jgi:hypothetical protein
MPNFNKIFIGTAILSGLLVLGVIFYNFDLDIIKFGFFLAFVVISAIISYLYSIIKDRMKKKYKESKEKIIEEENFIE